MSEANASEDITRFSEIFYFYYSFGKYQNDIENSDSELRSIFERYIEAVGHDNLINNSCLIIENCQSDCKIFEILKDLNISHIVKTIQMEDFQVSNFDIIDGFNQQIFESIESPFDLLEFEGISFKTLCIDHENLIDLCKITTENLLLPDSFNKIEELKFFNQDRNDLKKLEHFINANSVVLHNLKRIEYIAFENKSRQIRCLLGTSNSVKLIAKEAIFVSNDEMDSTIHLAHNIKILQKLSCISTDSGQMLISNVSFADFEIDKDISNQKEGVSVFIDEALKSKNCLSVIINLAHIQSLVISDLKHLNIASMCINSVITVELSINSTFNDCCRMNVENFSRNTKIRLKIIEEYYNKHKCTCDLKRKEISFIDILNEFKTKQIVELCAFVYLDSDVYQTILEIINCCNKLHTLRVKVRSEDNLFELIDTIEDRLNIFDIKIHLVHDRRISKKNLSGIKKFFLKNIIKLSNTNILAYADDYE